MLRLVKGDIVYVLEKHASGWWGGHKEGDETTGWFPSSVAMQVPLGDSVDYDGDDEHSRALERDHRAVASPQPGRRTEKPTEPQDMIMQDLAKEQRKVKELESTLLQERGLKETFAEDVRRLEAEISRVRAERDAEKQERREEMAKLKQERDERQRLEALDRNDAQAQAALEREAVELRSALRDSRQEVNRLQDQLGRRDEHIAQKGLVQADFQRRDEFATMEARLQAAQFVHKQPADDRRPNETSMTSQRSVLQGTPPGSASREDASRTVIHRQLSNSTHVRQLFTQSGSDDAPPVSARGMNRHTSEPLQALQTASGHAMSAAAPASNGCVRLLSAQPPRPSPRGNPTQLSTPVPPWRSHSQGATVAASPRGAKAIAAMQGIDSRPPAQVRAIVQDFERRSTSQTPTGATRSVEAYPTASATRTTTQPGATTRAASATAPCASSRVPSHGPMIAPRGELMRGRQQLDEPHGSPTASEDRSSAVVFGMSPMNRPRSEKAPLQLRGGMTPSPQPKGISVQERIRAFQRH